MDSENESIKLVSDDATDRPPHKQYVPETNGRDVDSLNNLVVHENDAELTFNHGKIQLHTDVGWMGSSGCSINETTGLKRNRIIVVGDKGFDITSRLCFKDEFDKHRQVLEKGMKEGSRNTEIQYQASSSKSIWRSFISLCIGLFFAFMSFMPLRNIQTSLYPWRHLGNYSLAAMYLSFAIGCLFSNWITQNSRPKGIILVAIFGHVIFCAANIYPSAYTLIPASSFFGFSHAILWSTQELMIASYGASYTAISHMTINKTIHQFQSVFLVFCHASQVLGNLIESAILRSGDYEQSRPNMSVYLYRLEKDLYENGIEITNITDKVDTSDNLVWVGPFGYKIQPDLGLSSGDKPNYETIVKLVFIAFAVIGMTILCLFLNKPDIIVHKKKLTLCESFRAIRKFLTTGTFYALFLLMLFSGMQQAVVIGNVTKVSFL
ncbi:hypothetical protein DPMN_178570 [Dreissena polymorpha]|uniref:UNC93-like protein n=1 Tax=Dreissena polymorpha TaxID=45954 RepID=A0A9D4ED53_DREPO|nr:hypothetical protein DPMN_178570 [Dreissena polymorpha]